MFLLLAALDEHAHADARDCTLVKEVIQLKSGTVSFPTSGKIVIESHLATREDTFNSQALFPADAKNLIQAHLDRSCEALRRLFPNEDCASLYRAPWSRQWTPAEGRGLFGQGSVGDLKPTVAEELWGANMNWGSGARPAPGTRFLASHGERHVVVVMGYESGPTSSRLLAGLQTEVAWALGVANDDIVEIGRLVDQQSPPGPVECALPAPHP
jgi:hypothetical protein